jgi:hypothetical protein
MQSGQGRILCSIRFANLPRSSNGWGLFPSMAAMNKSLAQMRSPVVGKATNEACGPTRPIAFFGSNEAAYGQDFTETAQQLARLDQQFRQASFAEFKMLMAFDHEALKRYGLPKPMVERAFIEVYETVVLGQQRYRDHF